MTDSHHFHDHECSCGDESDSEIAVVAMVVVAVVVVSWNFVTHCWPRNIVVHYSVPVSDWQSRKNRHCSNLLPRHRCCDDDVDRPDPHGPKSSSMKSAMRDGFPRTDCKWYDDPHRTVDSYLNLKRALLYPVTVSYLVPCTD